MDDVSAAFGLFGREDALRVVNEVLVGGGSAVAIGDPGAGKSSLLRAAAQLAMVRRRRVLSVTPTQFEQGLPFAGLAELIGQLPDGADGGLPGPQRRALAAALQRGRTRRGRCPGRTPGGPGAADAAVRVGPVALVIDDLQWLDQASAGSLGFALRRISVEPRRLSVLVATRPDPRAEPARGRPARARSGLSRPAAPGRASP